MPSALVTFRAGGRRYGLDLVDVSGVRERGPIRPLPSPLPGVLGVLDDGEGTGSPVLAPFGDAGAHLIAVCAGGTGGTAFALLVDEVERVVPVPPGDLSPAPAGQAEPLVAGVLGDILVVDPVRLAARLQPPGTTDAPGGGT